MDRIVNDMTTLTCALHDVPTIACDNQLAVIQALHHAIQRWAKLTLPTRTKPHITNPPPTSTRHCSILCHMRRTHEDQTLEIPPRVVIQKPNTSPIPTAVPSTTGNYEPLARRKSSRAPHTVDQLSPRVNKTPDTGTISRRTRPQTGL